MYALHYDNALALLDRLLKLWFAGRPARYEDINWRTGEIIEHNEIIGIGINRPKLDPWEIGFYLASPSPSKWLERLLIPYLAHYLNALKRIGIDELLDIQLNWESPCYVVRSGGISLQDYLTHMAAGNAVQAVACLHYLDLADLIRNLLRYACAILSPQTLEVQERIAMWCRYARHYDWLNTLPRGLVLEDLAEITVSIAIGWKWEEPLVRNDEVTSSGPLMEYLLAHDNAMDEAILLWQRGEFAEAIRDLEFPNIASQVTSWVIALAIVTHYETDGDGDDWLIPVFEIGGLDNPARPAEKTFAYPRRNRFIWPVSTDMLVERALS